MTRVELVLTNLGLNNPTGGVLVSLALVVIGWYLAHYLTKLLRMLMRGSSVSEVSILVNLVRALIAFTVIYFIAENVFHVQLDGVARAFGITTLFVTLGLQDLIKNVVAGVQILLTQQFAVGDQIEVSGARGAVADVNWRQTMIRDKDGNIYVLPNSVLMDTAYLHRIGKMAERYVIDCEIKTGLDLERVGADIERLADAVLDERGWRTQERTEVRFVGATANGVQASIRIFLKDIEYTTRGVDAVMRAIGQRGYLADWTNELPAQEPWR